MRNRKKEQKLAAGPPARGRKIRVLLESASLHSLQVSLGSHKYVLLPQNQV